MKATIKRGAMIFQDFLYCAWPECKPPGYPEATECRDPDMEFDVRDGYLFQRESTVQLIGPGFGETGDCGNGGIIVNRADIVQTAANRKDGG